MYGEREFFDYGGTVFVVPMCELPYWRLPMGRRRDDPRWASFEEDHPEALRTVRRALREHGPLGNRDFTAGTRAARASGSFRSTKETSAALYYLWLTGELMTHRRRGFERLYHFRDAVAPPAHNREAPAAEAEDFFARKAIDFLGLATGRVWASWLGNFTRRPLGRAQARERLAEMIDRRVLAPVEVAGSTETHFTAHDQLPTLDEIEAGGVPAPWRPVGADTSREVTFVAPLDIVSARGRAAKLFDFDYVWEVYKPASQRRWGYYTMPVLFGDRLVARTDTRVDREHRTLEVRGLWFEEGVDPDDTELLRALAAGFARLARLVAADRIALTVPTPPGLAGQLRPHLAVTTTRGA